MHLDPPMSKPGTAKAAPMGESVRFDFDEAVAAHFPSPRAGDNLLKGRITRALEWGKRALHELGCVQFRGTAPNVSAKGASSSFSGGEGGGGGAAAPVDQQTETVMSKKYKKTTKQSASAGAGADRGRLATATTTGGEGGGGGNSNSVSWATSIEAAGDGGDADATSYPDAPLSTMSNVSMLLPSPSFFDMGVGGNSFDDGDGLPGTIPQAPSQTHLQSLVGGIAEASGPGSVGRRASSRNGRGGWEFLGSC